METPQNEMEMYKKTLLYLENSYNSKDNEKVPEAGRELKILSTDLKTHLYYKVIEIHYKENNPQIALIAHTFPNQALGNALNIMYEYGKQCYKNLNPYLSKENQ